MSKRQFKSQASSGRVGGHGAFAAFASSGFASTASSVLSYIQEPPDYSAISDSNNVVAFKNLSKKDATTKAKALEEIAASWSASEADVEDAMVELWVKQYPRLSVDSARRVRQLSHQLTGQLGAKSGKRIAKHLPRISAPWLAGTYDADRSVSKSAQEALLAVFPTQDKIVGLRRTFQEPILEYCKVALLNETVGSLSDERSVTADDAKATYARVVSTCISLLSSLLDTLSAEHVSKQTPLYEEILGEKKVWEFSHHEDSTVRKSTHRLVNICLRKKPDLIDSNLAVVSNAYIYKGLSSDQTGSSIDFAQTLEALTKNYPSIWTTAYTGKKSAISRLRQCLKNGAHSGPSSYWEVLTSIIHHLPDGFLPATYQDIADLLLAARDGVSKKEERFNASASWPAYFSLVDVLVRPLPEEDAQRLLEAFAMPPIQQFLQPSEQTARWLISGPKPASIVSKAAKIHGISPLLEHEWPRLADQLIETVKTSLPEQSKDFGGSQKHVASAGERWSALQRELLSGPYNLSENVQKVFVIANTKVLEECIAVLKTRNGKPYGAAAVVEEQIRHCASHFLQDQEFKPALVQFVNATVPELIFGPSQRQLVRCLLAVRDEGFFEGAFQSTLRQILTHDALYQDRMKALHALFLANTPQAALEAARNDPELQRFLTTRHDQTDADAADSLFAHLLKLGAVPQTTSDHILSELTQSLSLSGASVEHALSRLQQIVNTNQSALRTFMSTETGEKLLPNVLRLESSQDDTVAETASSLAARLTSSFADATADTKHGVILQSLEKVSQSSLPIYSVVELATNLIGDEPEVAVVKEILPSIEIWKDAIAEIATPPKASLALLSLLGGAVHLVQTKSVEPPALAQYDAEGFSQAFRIAVYHAAILKKTNLQGSDRETVMALLHICMLLAEDSTSVLGANGLWQPNVSRNIEQEVMEFVSDVNLLFKKEWDGRAKEPHESAVFAVLESVQRENSDSPLAYYAALSAAKLHDNLFELHGISNETSKASEEKLRARRGVKDRLTLITYIVGHTQPLTGSQLLTRLCNEAVADLTDLQIETSEQKALGILVLLNTILHTQSHIIEGVAKPRLIFLMKHIVPWLDADLALTTKSEVCKALTNIVPGMADMYGEHWTQIVALLVSSWSSISTSQTDGGMTDTTVLMIHATLRLYGALQKFSREDEPNDDLLEAIRENEKPLQAGLISLLSTANGVSDETHQPLMVTNELLARHISQLPIKQLADPSDLFPLMFTPSHAIQGAAFDLLHKHIPSVQEQISFDAALEDKKAALPDELLSLIIDAPTLDSLAEASFDTTMPMSLQGYLYSWRLVFDHFNGASFRVKNDYVEQLKEGGYTNGFLDLLFAFLGHSRGRPIDASNFDPLSYEPGLQPSPEKEVQALLTHLYYLSLAHLPSLVKNHLTNEIRSRQTPKTIESWTAKHISPLIIESSLRDVSHWAAKTVDQDPDYAPMTVRVNPRGREISVAYQIDDSTMAMKIVLPEAYPLQNAKPEGIHRVAVSEQKWRGWLMNCQGTITFSNGSIIDALSSWRRNVAGALKGHVECAICYSIINEAKELPTKRCPTCKNVFHNQCLFRWFRSSNSSTCPLCRQPYHYN